jgi:hypothetical protein
VIINAASRFASIDSMRTPIVDKDDTVVTTHDYAVHCGIKDNLARARLCNLEKSGKIRKVLFKQEGKLTNGWQLLETEREPSGTVAKRAESDNPRRRG